jgi:hypothetical protein
MRAVKRLGPVAVLILLALVLSGVWAQSGFGQPQIGQVQGTVRILPDAVIVDYGKVIYRGKLDLNPTLDRIRKGEKLPHRNDGSIFMNREKRLPLQQDRSYYREFVVKIQGLPFPGPQRMVLGKRGEVFFTGDHYATFTRVK